MEIFQWLNDQLLRMDWLHWLVRLLIEVPVMLWLVRLINNSRTWYERALPRH